MKWTSQQHVNKLMDTCIQAITHFIFLHIDDGFFCLTICFFPCGRRHLIPLFWGCQILNLTHIYRTIQTPKTEREKKNGVKTVENLKWRFDLLFFFLACSVFYSIFPFFMCAFFLSDYCFYQPKFNLNACPTLNSFYHWRKKNASNIEELRYTLSWVESI